MSEELIYYRSQTLETDTLPVLVSGSGDTPSNDLILDESENYLLLQVTEQQYSRMLSALFNGAYTTYPLDFIDVVYPLIKAGKMTLCDAVLACIEDTPAIQQSIAFYGHQASITETTTEQQEILDLDVFSDQSPCDNDEIYGMTLQLARLLNIISEDILELFVTAFAAPGRLGDLIEAIPIIGLLPFDDILQFLEKLAEQVNDAYQAAYDQQILEDVSCALFCLAMDTCELTLEDARDYFEGLLSESVSNTDFATIVNDIIANNWLGEQSIWVMHWLILDTIIFGGEMLGIDSNRLMTTVATYFNDPNSDWEILCTDCSEVYYLELDATTSQGAVIINDGIWTDGVGFEDVFSGGVSRCYLRYNPSDDVLVEFFEMRFERTPSSTTGTRQLKLRTAITTVVDQSDIDGTSYPYPSLYNWSGSEGDINRFEWRLATSPQNRDIIIDRLRVKIETPLGIADWLTDGWVTYVP